MFDQGVFDEMYGHNASFGEIRFFWRSVNAIAAMVSERRLAGKDGVSEALSLIQREKSRLGGRSSTKPT
jgi:hypothetical protein